jgi:hypothetical protein
MMRTRINGVAIAIGAYLAANFFKDARYDGHRYATYHAAAPRRT